MSNPKRRYFTITRNNTDIGRVRAMTYEDAADAWARRESGRSAFANRISGVLHTQGKFCAYKPLPNHWSGSTSVNEPFHVTEE